MYIYFLNNYHDKKVYENYVLQNYNLITNCLYESFKNLI